MAETVKVEIYPDVAKREVSMRSHGHCIDVTWTIDLQSAKEMVARLQRTIAFIERDGALGVRADG